MCLPRRSNVIFANTGYGSLNLHAHPTSHFRISMLAKTANLTCGGVTRGLPGLRAQKVTKSLKARADLWKEAEKQHEVTYKNKGAPPSAQATSNNAAKQPNVFFFSNGGNVRTAFNAALPNFLSRTGDARG